MHAKSALVKVVMYSQHCIQTHLGYDYNPNFPSHEYVHEPTKQYQEDLIQMYQWRQALQKEAHRLTQIQKQLTYRENQEKERRAELCRKQERLREWDRNLSNRKKKLDAERAIELAEYEANCQRLEKKEVALDSAMQSGQHSLDARQQSLDARQESLDAFECFLHDRMIALDQKQSQLDHHMVKLNDAEWKVQSDKYKLSNIFGRAVNEYDSFESSKLKINWRHSPRKSSAQIALKAMPFEN